VEATDCIGRNCPFVVFLGSNPDDVASGTDYGSDCIAAGLTEHSKLSGIQHGVHKVGEVIFGCGPVSKYVDFEGLAGGRA
jgi:hypothetical protein